MTLSIIAAIGTNNELGKDNQLLWNLPEDMKHFRETTRGHTVIMGRKTFESIGRPLPNRRNIVITRDTTYTHPGIEVVHSLKEAYDLIGATDEEVFIIGGAQLYSEAILRADKLYITHVDGSFEADTFFPEISCEDWERVTTESHMRDNEHAHDYTFTIYQKTA